MDGGGEPLVGGGSGKPLPVWKLAYFDKTLGRIVSYPTSYATKTDDRHNAMTLMFSPKDIKGNYWTCQYWSDLQRTVVYPESLLDEYERIEDDKLDNRELFLQSVLFPETMSTTYTNATFKNPKALRVRLARLVVVVALGDAARASLSIEKPSTGEIELDRELAQGVVFDGLDPPCVTVYVRRQRGVVHSTGMRYDVEHISISMLRVTDIGYIPWAKIKTASFSEEPDEVHIIERTNLVAAPGRNGIVGQSAQDADGQRRQARLTNLSETPVPFDGEDVHVLMSGSGITDNIINHMLADNPALKNPGSLLDDVYIFSTHLAPMILADSESAEYNKEVLWALRQRIKKWGTYVDEDGECKSALLEKDFIFIPINIDNIHWVLYVVYRPFDAGMAGMPLVFVFDSLADQRQRFHETATNYVALWLLIVSNAYSADPLPASLLINRGYQRVNVNSQRNVVDCGFFVVGWIYYFIQRKEVRDRFIEEYQTGYGAPFADSVDQEFASQLRSMMVDRAMQK